MSILADNVDRFCGEIPLGYPDTSGVTLNQALAGRANPRTLVKPTIVAPIAELSAWRTNPTVTYSRLNTKTTKYPRLSGWTEDTFAVPQQPGIYTSTNVFQPINATNGIAIVPEFPDTTILIETPQDRVYYDTNVRSGFIEIQGDLYPAPSAQSADISEGYTSMGSNQPPFNCVSGQGCSAPPLNSYPLDSDPNLYSMYDPRLSGYGSDNRGSYML